MIQLLMLIQLHECHLRKHAEIKLNKHYTAAYIICYNAWQNPAYMLMSLFVI